MYGIIYKATNLINGKVYIGQTIREFDERVRQHITDSLGVRNSHYIFHVAIRKYGADNFKFEIIDNAQTEQELNEKEMYWIKYYHSYIRDEQCNGYNMTIGGDGLGSGENHPRYGVKATDETRKKMSESKKALGLNGENNPFFNKKHSKETIANISKNRKGKNLGNTNAKGKHTGKDNNMYRPIVQLTMDNKFVAEYETAKDGAMAVNGDNSTIGKVCKGKLKSHKGFKWLYKEDYEKLIISY